MADQLNVLVICGSLRKGSYNAALTRALPALAPPEMKLVTAPPFDTLPLYNEDVQNASGFPGPAVDLAASADALHLRPNRLYELYFLWKLNQRLRTKARLFPGAFDTSRLRGIASLRQFDDRITAYYCGFAGADDYYDRASASHVIDRIAVPTFILNAANDPFIRILPETRRKIMDNPNITFVETEDGGHCSYLAESNGSSDDGRWAESRVVEFLTQFQ